MSGAKKGVRDSRTGGSSPPGAAALNKPCVTWSDVANAPNGSRNRQPGQALPRGGLAALPPARVARLRQRGCPRLAGPVRSASLRALGPLRRKLRARVPPTTSTRQSFAELGVRAEVTLEQKGNSLLSWYACGGVQGPVHPQAENQSALGQRTGPQSMQGRGGIRAQLANRGLEAPGRAPSRHSHHLVVAGSAAPVSSTGSGRKRDPSPAPAPPCTCLPLPAECPLLAPGSREPSPPHAPGVF